MHQAFNLKTTEHTVTYGVVLSITKEFITICYEWSAEDNVDSWFPEVLPMGMITKITKLGEEAFIRGYEDG